MKKYNKLLSILLMICILLSSILGLFNTVHAENGAILEELNNSIGQQEKGEESNNQHVIEETDELEILQDDNEKGTTEIGDKEDKVDISKDVVEESNSSEDNKEDIPQEIYEEDKLKDNTDLVDGVESEKQLPIINQSIEQLNEEITIKTDLDSIITKTDKLTFDLWVKDSNGNKIDTSYVKVTNNEKIVNINWDDVEKTSYTLELEIGENEVEISVDCNGKIYTEKYVITRVEIEEGEVIGTITFSMEAFTIGLGYLIEPIQVDIYNGQNAAQQLSKIIQDNGYNFENTGSLENSFYLSRIIDDTNQIYKITPSIPEVLKNKLHGDYNEENYESGGLGEFDFNSKSGWMFSVNNIFPNVGFSDKYLKDGDIMRVQFTLAYGNDIGGSESMGGTENEYFYKTNKDELTKEIAKINSGYDKNEYLSSERIQEAYDDSIDILQKLDATQEEIDTAHEKLINALENPKDIEPPVIIVDGLKDEENVEKNELTFTVKATDNIDENINLVIKCNGDIITGTNGQYYISLIDGENIITIEATDLAGNKSDETYKLIYKPLTKVETINLDKVNIKLLEGECLRLNPTILPNNATNKNILWESSNEEVAKVSINGKVTAIKKGIANITVTAEDGSKKAICLVTVNEKDKKTLTPKEQLNKNLEYIFESTQEPTFGVGGGEWSILSLARGEHPVTEGYYDIYYNNVVSEVKKLMERYNGKLHRAKGTEHSRLMLGLGSIGKDITNVGGYDIREALADFDYVTKQGINGPIFALIGLDTNNYEIPIVNGIKEQTTRDKLIQFILDKEIQGGGWALGGSTADPDITAMAIQGLTPYYDRTDVKGAVDRGFNWLSQVQHDDGGYFSWGSINAESIAQVVVALTGLGIDPHTDPRFIKNGNSAIDALMTFALPDGGFMHVKAGQNTGGGPSVGGQVDGMATDQGTYALVAYYRFINGKNHLYDMTDAFKDSDVEVPGKENPKDIDPPVIIVDGLKDEENVEKNELTFTVKATDNIDENINLVIKCNGDIITGTNGQYYISLIDGENIIAIEATDLAGNKSDETYKLIYKKDEIKLPEKQRVIKVPQDNKEYDISITEEDKNKEITIEIPDGKRSKVVMKLFNYEFPEIQVSKGNILGTISKGTRIIRGNLESIQLITTKDKQDRNLIKELEKIINRDEKLETINEFFSIGGVEKLEFNDYVTLRFKGLRGKEAAYIQGSKISKIQKYSNYLLGQNSGKSEYAYDDGRDLIVKTKHFTDFIAYTTSEIKDNNSNSDDGKISEPSRKAYITLSIDKLTINKGYTLRPTKVEIIEGESVWDVLKREMENNNIDYDYVWTPKYNSVYIEWIDGDGEFDHGSGSGWMYNVNGWYPNYGASVYKLKDGDVVEWRYTTNLGQDLGEDITKWDQPTIAIDGIKDRKEVTKKELAFKVIAKATYGPIRGENASVTVKLNGINKIGRNGVYNVTLKEGKNILEIIAIDSNENRRDEKYTIIYNPTDKENIKGIKTPLSKNKSTSSSVSATDFKKSNDINVVDEQKLYLDSGEISSWAYEYVKKATEMKFIAGSNGRFNPKSKITRSEFVKIITFILELDTNVAKSINFIDVSERDWFYPYVNAAYIAGIIKGEGNKFNPKENITREQMAAIIVRALDLKYKDSSGVIKDLNKVSDWAKDDVKTAIATGLMVGSDDIFNPKSFVTREMAVVVAFRGYEYKNNKKIEAKEEQKLEKTKVQHQANVSIKVEKTNYLDVKDQINKTADFMQKTITDPIVASVGGEWTVFGLARSGVKVPEQYYDKYYDNLEKTLKEKKGKLHRIKYTEYDRVILALTSIGKDIKNVVGYDLTKPLADFDTLIIQGINGPIFALIALDSNDYEIPIVKEVKNQTTRDKLIQFILDREIKGGGWALGENPLEADPDITAMAIQSLTPYYHRPEVKASIDRGLDWLSKAQHENGGYFSWGSINSESIAQVIVTLTGLGIDPHTDHRFIKNGNSAMEALLSFAAPEGGFYHVKAGGKGNGGAKPGDVDPMATDQAMYGLVAYYRFINGQNRLYDMKDVK